MKHIISIFLSLIYCSIFAQENAVGSMGGSFAVSDMGAATYTIPIDVPQGINGMQPNIALVYNSQNGNGVCGLGFSISGLSTITRIPRTIYYDGTAKGIKYDATDAFALDGVRLIRMGQYLYNPENAPFDNVTQSGEYFVVKLQNGNTAYYGQTTDSRATTSGIVYTWYLNKIEDTHGNTITYNYTTDNGCVYLQQISYGGNSKTASGLTNIVVFVYENRTDAVPFNVKGVRCEMKKRLKTIQTKTNGTLRNMYTLSYTNADYFSQLTNISVKYGTTLLPPISFAYGKKQAQSTPTQISSIVSSYNSTTLDINGDGLCDIATVSSNSVQLYCAQKSDATLSFSEKSITTDCAKVSKETTTQGDVNGDGRTDLILVTNNQATEAIKKQSDGIYSVNVGKDEVAFDVGDFFNDGKSGLLYLKKKASGATQCKLLYYNTNGTTQTLSGQLTLPNTTQTVKVSDWNGDGMADLLVVGSAGYTIFWNNGVAATSFPFSDSNKTTGSTFKASDIMDYGDFDGDGLLDVLLFDNLVSKVTENTIALSYEFTLVTNKRNGSFSKKKTYSIPEIIKSPSPFDDLPLECKIFDVNNDGKDDILFERLNTINRQINYDRGWLVSDGETLVQYSQNTSKYSIGVILKGDFDGDGYEELMAECDDLYKGGGTRLSSGMYLYANKANQQTYKLTSITEANNGAQITILYSTLSDKDVYKRGSSSAYPLADVTLPFSVVKQTNSMVAGRTYTTKYRYEGLRAHMQGLGYLGFTTVEVNDGTTGTKRATTIKALNTQYYEPSQIVTTTTQDGKTSSVETLLGYAGKTSRSYFGYTVSTKKTDIYGDETTTQNTFDPTYGYITKQRTEYGGSNMYKQTEFQSYAKVAGTYKPQTIITTQKHTDAPELFSQKNTYIYNSTNGDIKQMTENATIKPVKHDYTYDTFGNVLTHTTSADGVPTVTATNTYDATHRFVASQKSSANQIIATYTYNNLGRLLESSQGVSGAMLKTTYTYDAIGNIATITHPDATKTTYTRGWGSSAQKRYYVKEERTAAAPITKWYDNANREVETTTTGEKGIIITNKKTYNNTFGTIASTTSSVGALSLTNTYSYNKIGLLTQLNHASGSITAFSYAQRKCVTTFVGSRSTIQTFDAWGNVKNVTDGTVTLCIYTYAANGNPTNIKYVDQSEQNNTETTMGYDALGQQTQLTDPNAGTTKYEYDALGRIVKQTDARGNETKNTYNAAGLITNQTCGNFTTNYTYTATQKLSSEYTDNARIEYSYDYLDRLKKKIYTIDGNTLSFVYSYNNKNGQLISKTRPDAVTESYTYDDNGNIATISINGTKVWELNSYNGKQRTVAMGALIATKTFSNQGRLIATSMQKQSSMLHSMSYTYDNLRGNIKQRTGMTSSPETFTYDAFDRLTSATTKDTTRTITYALNGNITNKTGIGAYTYNKIRPHAVTQVTNVDKLIKQTALNVKYNAFNKAYKITQGSTTLDITYGPNRQRCKTIYSDGKNTSTTLYAGSYERRTENGTTRGYNYIYSPDGDLVAICLTQSGKNTIYHVETDHLGSIVRVYDTNGNTVYSASYDAWGKQTILKNTLNLRRGFTQHEHWNEFDLIDMNGRMYDPVIGRFLSPDPYVQNATNPQNFNRYSYCLNNPLKYTDPSGMKHQPDMNDAGFGFDGGGGGGGDFGFNAGSAAWSVGKNGTHNENRSWGSSSYSTYATCNNAYYITNPSIINNYYTSGMNFADWVDEQVRTGNATHLLGGVSVVAYNQASYDRAAQNIWYQVHYADDYSGGWYSSGQSFSGGGSGSSRGGGGNNSYSSSKSYNNSGPDASGVQISFNFVYVMGAGVDLLIGTTRTGKKFISVSLSAGLGWEMGMSAGIFTSYYTHGENTIPNYSPENMAGQGTFYGGGMGLSYSRSSSNVSPNDIQNNDYHHWVTNSFQMGGDLGGSFGIDKTYVPYIR